MENYKDLIRQLTDCAITCEQCATACLNESNVQAMTNCIKLDRDCTDVCHMAAKLLIRDSVIGRQFLLICEEMCRKCAEECAKHDMDHCQRCAEACRNCADACHEHHEPILQS